MCTTHILLTFDCFLPRIPPKSGACLGDCDSDDECAPGLSCFIRGTGALTPIYGCAGFGIAGLDYCYNATDALLHNATTHFSNINNASVDIDQVQSDREDASGGGSSIPVLAPSTSAAPAGSSILSQSEKEDFSSRDDTILEDVGCSEAMPCKECQVNKSRPALKMKNGLVLLLFFKLTCLSTCQGDCNRKDSLCGEGLECFVRRGNDDTPILGCTGTGTPGTDYCWAPLSSAMSIREGPCSALTPCQKCQGSCYADSDCLDGLRCFQRNDLSVVPGCGNGFSGVNFCWDPADAGLRGRRQQLLRR